MPSSSVISKIAHEVYEHQPSTMPDGRWWDNTRTIALEVGQVVITILEWHLVKKVLISRLDQLVIARNER